MWPGAYHTRRQTPSSLHRCRALADANLIMHHGDVNIFPQDLRNVEQALGIEQTLRCRLKLPSDRKWDHNPWLLVGLLWFVWLLNYLDRQVIFSVFPLLQTELKLNGLELGLISTAFLWVYAIAGPAAGYLADHFSRKRIIVFSLFLWSAVTFATGHARNLPQLLTARALMGITEACYLPAGLALIAAYHDERTRSKATGIHYTGGYIT